MAEDNRSLAGQTADALIAYIVDRGLEQGDRLPNERELSGLLGVGRSTLREAVRMLSSRNILEARQGAGVFVSGNTGVSDDPLGFTFIRDKQKLAADLVEFRMMLEPRVAALAALRATPAQADELAAAGGVRVTVISEDGTVLADSEADAAQMKAEWELGMPPAPHIRSGIKRWKMKRFRITLMNCARKEPHSAVTST